MIVAGLRFLRDHLGSRWLVIVALIDSIGTGLFLAGAVVFYVRFTGLSATDVGLGLSIAGAVGFFTTVPVGVLADRAGPRRMLVLAQFWRCAAVLSLLFVSDGLSFIAAASMLAIGDCAAPSLTQAVVGVAVEEDVRVQNMAIISATRNIGFSVGAVLAAPLIAASTPWAFRAVMLGDGVSFILAGLILRRLPLAPAAAGSERTTFLTALLSFRDWRYGILAALDSVLTLHASILMIGIPLWLIHATRAPAGLIAMFLLINTAMAVILQVPLSRGVVTARCAITVLRLAGVALAGCAVAMAMAAHVGEAAAVAFLVLATVLMTLAEVWQSAGSWALSYRYAAPERQAQSLAVFSLGIAAQEVFGPVLLTTAVIGGGTAGWLGLAGLFGVVTVLVGPATAALEHASGGAVAASSDASPAPAVSAV